MINSLVGITSSIDVHVVYSYRDKKGRLHREDGPALRLQNGNTYYYINGLLHREDGPALILDNNKKKLYAINGKIMNKRDFLKSKEYLKIKLKRIQNL